MARSRQEAKTVTSPYELIFDATPDVHILLDPNLQILRVNPAFSSLFGYLPQEVVGRQLQRLIVNWDQVGLAWPWSRPAEGPGHELHAPARFQHKDGGEFDGLIHLVELTLDEPEFGDILGVIHIPPGDLALPIAESRTVRRLEAFEEAIKRKDLIPLVLGQVGDAVSSEGVALALHDLPEGSLWFEAAALGWSSWAGMRFTDRVGITGKVLSSGSLYWNNDVRNDPLRNPEKALNGLTSVACVPIVESQRVVGVLWVGRRIPYEPDELQILMAAAGLAARALQGQSRLNSGVGGSRVLKAIQQADQGLRESQAVEPALQQILGELVTQWGVDLASVVVPDPSAIRLVPLALQGTSPQGLERIHRSIDASPSGKVIASRQKVQILDVARADLDGTTKTILTQEGFSSFIGLPLLVRGELKGVLELFLRRSMPQAADWTLAMEIIAGSVAGLLDRTSLTAELRQATKDLERSQASVLQGMSEVMALRDQVTGGHSPWMVETTLTLARAFGMPEEDLIHIERGVVLHDIGLIGVPDHILYKAGPLDENDWAVLRMHPVYGHDMLSRIPFLRPAVDIPYCHHERWDGSGYPRGLHKEAIPLAARIFAVVDVWDAMRSPRHYREPQTVSLARQFLSDNAGRLFDPRVVEPFLNMV